MQTEQPTASQELALQALFFRFVRSLVNLTGDLMHGGQGLGRIQVIGQSVYHGARISLDRKLAVAV